MADDDLWRRGDRIHLPTCRYAAGRGGGRWAFADEFPTRASLARFMKERAPWLSWCKVCKPLAASRG